MVEKVIKPGPNVVDFARYQAGRAGKALADLRASLSPLRSGVARW